MFKTLGLDVFVVSLYFFFIIVILTRTLETEISVIYSETIILNSDRVVLLFQYI